MRRKSPPRSNRSNVEVNLRVSATGVAVKAKLPAGIVGSAGKNLSRATQWLIASIAPERYLRTLDVLHSGDLRAALTKRLIREVRERDVAETLSIVATSSLMESASRQIRRLEIAGRATEDLKMLAPPAEEATGTISDDFISHFWNTADRVSSSDVRALFARILAKESLMPGSFSATTLNLLSILHPELARKFETFCCMSFGFADFDFVVISMPHGNAPSRNTNSIGPPKGGNGEQLSKYGVGPQDLLELRAIGLTRSFPGEEYPNLARFFELTSVEFAGERMTLRIRDGAPKEPGFSIADATNSISLTRSGSELRSILSLKPCDGYRDRLIEVMDNSRITLSR